MDVDDHDAAVARVSHLPHLMSVLMAGHLTAVPQLGPAAGRAGAARRHPDRRRRPGAVAADPQRQRDRGPGRAPRRRRRAGRADPLAGVRHDRRAALEQQLARGVDGTRRIPGKHGAAPATYRQVVVEIPDTPGALGRLFAEVGAAGVNVEDIAIEHDQARQIGYLALVRRAGAGRRPGGHDAAPAAGPSAPEPREDAGLSAAPGTLARVSEATRVQGPRTAAPSGARLVVAIDGPSGSGKSSTARGVADRLGLAFLDTGAMYRAATWLAVHEGLDLADADAVAALVRAASSTSPSTRPAPTIAVNGHDVTQAIRAPEVSAAVSAVATNLAVRADLVARQQRLIADAPGGVVAEGRDITTVVAPDAHVRVLLVADPAARVARRQAELGGRRRHRRRHRPGDPPRRATTPPWRSSTTPRPGSPSSTPPTSTWPRSSRRSAPWPPAAPGPSHGRDRRGQPRPPAHPRAAARRRSGGCGCCGSRSRLVLRTWWRVRVHGRSTCRDRARSSWPPTTSASSTGRPWWPSPAGGPSPWPRPSCSTGCSGTCSPTSGRSRCTATSRTPGPSTGPSRCSARARSSRCSPRAGGPGGEVAHAHGGAAYLAMVTGRAGGAGRRSWAPASPGTPTPSCRAAARPCTWSTASRWSCPREPWPRRRAEVARWTEHVRRHLAEHVVAAQALTGLPLPGPPKAKTAPHPALSTARRGDRAGYHRVVRRRSEVST